MKRFVPIATTTLMVLLAGASMSCQGCNGEETGEGPAPDATSDTVSDGTTDGVDDVSDTAEDASSDGADTTDTDDDAADASDTDADAVDGISQVRRFARDWERTYCEAVWECNSSLTRELDNERWGRFDSKQDCLDNAPRLADLNERLEPLVDSVEAGRLGFDESRIQGCLDTVETRLCNNGGVELAFRGQLAACPDIFEGKDIQRFCISDEACTDGLICEFSSVEGCGGRCESAGDECPCSAPEETCIDGSCEPLLDTGSVCGLDAGACAPHLICDTTGPEGQQPTCIPSGSKAPGELCNTDDYCGEGHTCQPNGLGETTCQAITTVGLDEPCDAQGVYCQPGLFCGEVSGQTVCTNVRDEGTPCTTTRECGFPNRCRTDGGQTGCRPPLADGEDCGSNADCVSTRCDNGGQCAPEQVCEAPTPR